MEPESPHRSRDSAGLSRRTLVQKGTMGAAGLALSRSAFAQTYERSAAERSKKFPARSAAPVVFRPTMLVDRITYGATQDEIARFNRLGWSGYLEYQLAPAAINESALDSYLQEFATLNATPYESIRFLSYDQGFDVYYELASAQLLRATFARRQLQEIMTEFWLDHFNVYINKIWHQFMPSYVRTIRKYALSDFKTLLTAVVKSGAMLLYLDNVQNEIGFHNENFARELLELHTLGVDNGYWEADIYVARRCFTGWNFEGYYEWPWTSTTNPQWGQFKFYPERHDNEGGYFLGTQPSDYIAKGGVEQGDMILAKLAAHPYTAQHIAQKLCTKFLGEGVSTTFVQSAASVFLNSQGSIRSLLRHILNQTNFKTNFGPKYKRPFHYVVSALRATNADVPDTGDILWNFLQPMRQQPFQWAPPNGYPDKYEAWADNLGPRWRFGNALGTNSLWGAKIDIYPYLQIRTPDAVVSNINRYLFGGNLSTTRQAELKAYMRPNSPTNAEIRETIGLALSSPDYMWY